MIEFTTGSTKIKDYFNISLSLIRGFGPPHLGTRIRLKLLSQALKKIKLKKGTKILDAGCGYGFSSFYLARKNFQVVSIDKDLNRLNVAKNLSGENLNIQYQKADIYHLPFSNSSFQMIVCFEVLEHLKKDFLALKELNRVLEKNGSLIISFPEKISNNQNLKRLSHFRAGYSIFELEDLASQTGFKIKHLYPYGKNLLGKITLGSGFELNQKSIILSILALPILYSLLILSQILPAFGKPSNFVAILNKV